MPMEAPTCTQWASISNTQAREPQAVEGVADRSQQGEGVGHGWAPGYLLQPSFRPVMRLNTGRAGAWSARSATK